MKSAYIIAPLLAITLLTGCQNSNYPDDAVLMPPLSALVINVNGENYTALPTMQGATEAFTYTYTLPVKIPANTGTVVQISFSDPAYSSDIQAGDKVEFVDNTLAVKVYSSGTLAATYSVVMTFNPPPFLYFIKTSDKDDDGNRYFLHLDKPQKIASGTYDEWFEGQIDLTASNWDNIGLVSDDLTTIYNAATGPWPAVSDYMWEAVAKAAPGTGCYPTEGPWNDWKAVGNNPDIVSPGVWLLTFNAKTLSVSMTMTQWCLQGTAVEGTKPMSYDPDTRLWSVSATLRAGEMKFVTTPVSFGDPTFSMGLSDGIAHINHNGAPLPIAQDGSYTITLDLSNPPYYTYNISKNS